MSILLIADHDNTKLAAATLNTLAAATQIGGEVHVLVAGAQCQSVAQAASQLPGVSKVLHADAAHLGQFGPENLCATVMTVAGNYTHILASATSVGKSVAPRIAALLDVAQVSEITAVKSANTFVRPIYAGNAFATVQSNDAKIVITVRATGFDAAPASGGTAVIESLAAAPDTGLSQVVRQELSKSERPDLTAAKIIVSGGRGLGDGDKYRAVLTPLADKLGAAMGASRAAVDAGFVPNDYQVGQTGKIVAPELYIAVGISGAIQHLAGMKDSKVIVAINKDPDAPIFSVADYGLVADLFVAVPELAAAL
ncbi:MAG: hypothetical protein RLZZ502_133 [Pseudomonadota bacterium]|jgi:electron transfer flavoprotein alpha subunit